MTTIKDKIKHDNTYTAEEIISLRDKSSDVETLPFGLYYKNAIKSIEPPQIKNRDTTRYHKSHFSQRRYNSGRGRRGGRKNFTRRTNLIEMSEGSELEKCYGVESTWEKEGDEFDPYKRTLDKEKDRVVMKEQLKKETKINFDEEEKTS